MMIFYAIVYLVIGIAFFILSPIFGLDGKSIDDNGFLLLGALFWPVATVIGMASLLVWARHKIHDWKYARDENKRTQDENKNLRKYKAAA